MSNNDFTANIDNKDDFIKSVKDEMDATVFNALNNIKKDMASDFIKGEDDGSAETEE